MIHKTVYIYNVRYNVISRVIDLNFHTFVVDASRTFVRTKNQHVTRYFFDFDGHPELTDQTTDQINSNIPI